MSNRRRRVLLSSLSPRERELAEWFQALPPSQQDKWLRLMRVVGRATKRGDEFTMRRFRKVPVHLGIDHLLTEMERTPAR